MWTFENRLAQFFDDMRREFMSAWPSTTAGTSNAGALAGGESAAAGAASSSSAEASMAPYRWRAPSLFSNNDLMPWSGLSATSAATTWPSIPSLHMDIIEKDNSLVVKADLPGVRKEDIRVSIDSENRLTISAEKKAEHREESDRAWFAERKYGRVARTVCLPVNVEGGKAKAHFEGGVLNLEFDKLPDSKHAQQNIQIE